MLYEDFDSLVRTLGSDFFKSRVPDWIAGNLNPALVVREYQREALGRFVFYMDEYKSKQIPVELLFNMATGSGKTLVMAGTILYLYEKGYRNFLFFTRLDGVVKKTIDNFTNQQSSKYLFAPKVVIDGKEIKIKTVDTFEGAGPDDISIKFQTIAGLHSNLHNPGENSVTFEELEGQKIVLLGDEAHNFNAATRAEQEAERSWEQTIEKLIKTNKLNENIFLAFTATIEWSHSDIAEKYRSKTLYRYDLAQFRADLFSKDIYVAGIDMDAMDRALGAVILSQYRRKVAEKYGKLLKPVVLFKSKRITESQEFEVQFHEQIRGLKVADIAKFKKNGGEALQKAFVYFNTASIPLGDLVREIKDDFAPGKCVSVNSKEESETTQLLVNSLEEKTNPIRAVFAVDKLNEGWDVLNLFDIVRLYETRQSGGRTISPVTMAEAQLIGRGARYWPFSLVEDESDKYIRKFDTDVENEMRILEQLHYHTKYDSRYVAEIRSALIKTGAIAAPENIREYKVIVKEEIKQSSFWKNGQIFLNEKIHTGRKHIKGIKDIPGLPGRFVYELHRGGGHDIMAFDASSPQPIRETVEKDADVIDATIWRAAIYRSPFYKFDSLVRFFPHISSISEFIESKEYLGGVVMAIRGEEVDISAINREELLQGALDTLRQIEHLVRNNTGEYEGTRQFEPQPIHTVVKDKNIKVVVSDVGEQEFGVPMKTARNAALQLDLGSKDWYVYDENYGTEEEKRFVHFIHSAMTDLGSRYQEVRLLRNEKLFKIHRFSDGAAIEPDFVLFLRESKGKKSIVYHLFVEPKGSHLVLVDKWKEDFLKEIGTTAESKTLFESTEYRIVGLPFYTHDNNTEFEKEFEEYK